jgi:cell division initiation protein
MITPLDIENKKFSKQVMNGYSVEEVDDFLDDLTIDYTKNYKEATELKSKITELTQSLEHYKTIEETLQNTLIMAQSTAEDVKKVAKQQADQIVNEAKQQSEKIISDAKSAAQTQLDALNSELISKNKQLEDVKKQFDIYKAKMESLLISQLELIKDINKED